MEDTTISTKLATRQRKEAFILWCSGIVAALVHYCSCYMLGYFESFVVEMASHSIAMLAVQFFFFATLMFLVLEALFRRRKVQSMTLALLLSYWPAIFLTFMILWFIIGSGGNLLLYGVRDRLNHDYTSAQLHDLAIEIKKSDSKLNTADPFGVDLGKLSNQRGSDYDKLSKRYPFLMSADKVYFDNELQAACFEWQDGFFGTYWGVAISTDYTVPDHNYLYSSKPTNPEDQISLGNNVDLYYDNCYGD